VATQTIEIRAVDKTQRALKNIENNTKRLQSSFSGVTKAAGAFVAILGAREIIQFATRIKDTTATFQNYRNQLRLVTNGQQDLTRVFGLLEQAAVQNRTSFGETIDLFTKLRVSTEALGISEERVIDVTGKLSQALQVAGADGNTAASVIRQFGQAMASGEVRGDEFRSLVEGLGPALAIMARESGITVGELRTMSQAGELTAETLFKMLENSNSLTASFQSMQPTISQLETALSDAFDRALVKLGDATGFTEAYENTVRDLTYTFNDLADANKLADKSQEQLFNGIKDGSIPAQDAIREMLGRIDELDKAFRLGPLRFDLPNFGSVQDTIDEMYEFTRSLYALEAQLLETAKQNDEAAAAQAEINKQVAAAMAPFNSFINLAEKYQKSGFGSALDKNEAKIAAVNKALEQLAIANKTVIEVTGEKVVSDEKLIELTGVLNLELAALIKQNKKLKDAQSELVVEGLSYASFMEDLIESTNKSVTMDGFKAKAITEISAQFRDGAISLKQYNTAMLALDSDFKTAAERQAEEAKRIKDIQDEQKVKIGELTEKYRTHFMTQVELAEDAFNKEKELIDDAFIFGSIKSQQRTAMLIDAENILQSELSKIRDKAAEEEKKRQEALLKGNLRDFTAGKLKESKVMEMTEENKKKFFIEGSRDTLDEMARFNKQAFQMKKALALIDVMLSAKQTVMSMMAAGAAFGPIGAAAGAAIGVAMVASQIAAVQSMQYTGRQHGGALRAGQASVIGEDGPELIVPKQPSTVIPREVAQAVEGLGGGRGDVVNVNFTINAVDARGVDELLLERRGTITGIINQAMQSKGRRGVV
jgi:tape measure domain-containing protein